MKPSNDSTVDEAQIARFDATTFAWWDPKGEARWLHKYNPVRLDYIRRIGCRRFDRDPRRDDWLSGLRMLDIGCGGGVLCEPLAEHGARVVGVDPGSNNIRIARQHAEISGLDIDYRCTTAEALADSGEQFDLVLAMEVVEHVADSTLFLSRCAELVRPGGLMVLSTINRTVKSFAYAIVMGEHVLRLLPRGTHQWRRFVKPVEAEAAVGDSGMKVIDVTGVTLNVVTGALQLSSDKAVNYIMAAGRQN